MHAIQRKLAFNSSTQLHELLMRDPRLVDSCTSAMKDRIPHQLLTRANTIRYREVEYKTLRHRANSLRLHTSQSPLSRENGPVYDAARSVNVEVEVLGVSCVTATKIVYPSILQTCQTDAQAICIFIRGEVCHQLFKILAFFWPRSPTFVPVF